jgi:AcrR family transcriptional regulator
MGQYENGIETANRILAACRNLFYTKGYDNATFADISKEAHVREGAIYYHFKSKDTLLKIIYGETIMKNNKTVELYCEPDTTPFTKFLFGGDLYIHKVLHDKMYRLFNLDARRLFNVKNFDEYIRNLANAMYYNGTNDAVLNEDMIFELMASASYDHTLLVYLDKNIDTVDFRNVSKHNADIYRRIMRISDEQFALSTTQLAMLEAKCEWDRLDTSLNF